MDVQKVLASHGFLFTPKRAAKWRLTEGSGNIKNLPSFGLCHAIATDGVHMIVHHGNGKDVIEVHQTNWIPYLVPGKESVAPKNQPTKEDKSAAALTRLMADLL